MRALPFLLFSPSAFAVFMPSGSVSGIPWWVFLIAALILLATMRDKK
jgi:hypothetical protein